MIVKVRPAGRAPVEVVCFAFEMAIPLQETGTFWLTGAGRDTVGWPGAALHSRTVPSELGSKPEPVSVTTLPPLRHVPGVAVICGGPADVVGAGVQATAPMVVVVTVF
jgi:hypothetical protein